MPTLISRELSSDPHLVKRHQKPGLPYVFSRFGTGTHDAGPASFSLTLLGTAIPYLSLLVRVITAITGATCHLEALDYQMRPQALAAAADGSSDNLPVLDAAELLELSRPTFSSARPITLTMLTPLRLLHNGREVNRFEPELLIRAVLRRISALAACYGDGADSEWFRRCAALAGEVRVAAALPGTAAPTGERGIVGRYLLEGPWQELGPLLLLGSLLNAGKGASYGRGVFQVVPGT